MDIKRKFKIDGKEYGSVNEMPPDVRAKVEKMLSAKRGSGKGAGSAAKIVVNGVEYTSVDEMPDDVRAIYERAMKTAGRGDTDIMTGSPAAHTRESRPVVPESIFSSRSILAVLLFAALLALLYYWLKNS